MGGEEGWVKLPRSLLDFAWFDDPNTVYIYTWLLLNARRTDGIYHKRIIKRGQLVTSLTLVAAATNTTVKIVRLAIDRLRKANLIAVEATNKYTVITITDYDGEEPKKKAAPVAVPELPPAETPYEAKPFIPPTLEEVRGCFEEYGFRPGGQYHNRIDEIENFYYYYQSKGWMVGQNVMRDWKAAVRNWIRKIPNGYNRNNTGSREAEKEQRDREWAEYISKNVAGRSP